MLRAVFILLIIISSISITLGQSESDLKRQFEGQQVTLKIDMPATKDGVNVYPEKSQPMDYDEYARRMKKYGTSVRRGDSIMITKIKVKDKHIEVQLEAQEIKKARVEQKALQGGSRFNVHFTRMDSVMMTATSLMDALRRYVDFEGSADDAAALRKSGGYVRAGVLHVGPRTTFLKAGLSTRAVVELLGQPTSIEECQRGAQTISVYEFPRGDYQVLIAEFAGKVLINSRTEYRYEKSVATTRE